MLPNFRTLPRQFLTGAAAAAGLALIATVGNLALSTGPYTTGAVVDAAKNEAGEPQYCVPMVIVGSFLLLSAVLTALLSRGGRTRRAGAIIPIVAVAGR